MHDRTRIKICGIRDDDGALAAIDGGADALGFVFYEASSRFIDPEDAYPMVRALPPMVVSVGLFVNATADAFESVSRMCPTDYAQLHGQEGPDLVRACGPRVIKAIRFDAATIRQELTHWAAIDEVDAILVDGSAGGRGTSFDWAALADARNAASDRPLILAGGLTPDNVGEAIRAVRPFAVDVSSGVEHPDRAGEKDPARIRAFCRAVRAADASFL